VPANRGIAVLLVTLGLAVAFAPEDVPGLVVPGSGDAMQAMESMGMDGSGMESTPVDGNGMNQMSSPKMSSPMMGGAMNDGR
jgi:hypothetical protein